MIPDIMREPETKQVYKAISAVQAEIAVTGVQKGQVNKQQGWAFRGIDDFLNAMGPILAKYELCVIPNYLAREPLEEMKSKSGVTFHKICVTGAFTLVSAKDGSSHTATVFGEAMDNSDKATNKAMAIALKYFYIQTFQIPLIGSDDPDLVKVEPAKPHPNSKEAKEQKQKDRDDHAVFNVMLDMLLKGEESLFMEAIQEMSEEEKAELWKLFNTQERNTIREWSKNNGGGI